MDDEPPEENVLPFPIKKELAQTFVWECPCGGQTFRVFTDGTALCENCEELVAFECE